MFVFLLLCVFLLRPAAERSVSQALSTERKAHMNEILAKQLSLDYCCALQEVFDCRNHFTEHRLLDGRRRFQEDSECFLKIAVINGKILFSGSPGIISWCGDTYGDSGAEWFLEAKNLRLLNNRLYEEGRQIQTVHPFFIAESRTDVDTSGYDLRWYDSMEIEDFRGDSRFDEAFAFCADAPDVLGVSAAVDGKLAGMAGASCDSPAMWQIGINVEPAYRGKGVGTMLVSLLKNEILRRGLLPFYGTSISHLASQRVALGAGFIPAWVELITSKIG